jgi:hypothetical protein
MKSQQELTKELRDYWDVQDFHFEGEYALKNNGKGYFRNILNPKDKSRIQFPNREKVTVPCPPNLILQEGTYYKINLFVPIDAIIEKFSQEYVLFVDVNNKPPRQIQSGPKEYVESIQKEYNSARGIALEALSGAMDRLVGDVSRKPETFIYELLQNADDYPDQKKGKVHVKFSIINDYLVFQHTGLPFKANNVRAICNVNGGDKGDDFEKIGFKGMGFKSIFNHSNYVIINSGGFCFRFDEEYHLLKGKETFWSLIPIWTNELPSIFKDFQNKDYAVSVFIKAKEGNEKLKSYYHTLEKIFSDERLLLFLRWVDKVEINGFEGHFERKRDSASWEISDLDIIEVPLEQREILNHRINVERTKVPEKYKDIKQVKIAFASKLSNGKMVQTENAKIYAYLPTELNFGFPFLLNADFIPDGNRSYLHADLEWNLFLFYCSGKELLKWVNKLWAKYHDASVYLMIPTKKELSSNQEDDERESFLLEFKRGIAEAQSNIPFISGIDNLTYTTEQIIIDNSGLFSEEIIDTSFFYSLKDSSKIFINNSIDAKRLKDANLEIESFSLNDLIEKIEIEENLETLSQHIEKLSLERKIKWLNWVEGKVSVGKLDSEIVLRLPLVFSKDAVFSINEIIDRKDFVISLNRFEALKSPLETLGIIFSDNIFDSIPEILALVSSSNNYLGDDDELFEKIISIEKLFELSPIQKNDILIFLEKLNGIADKTLGKVQIFKSQLGETAKSLNQLITSDIASQPSWLKGYILDIDEEKVLNNRFKNLLVQNDNIFEKIFCVENTLERICNNIDKTNDSEFYQYIIKMFKSLPEDHRIKYKDLAWIYSPYENKFKKSNYFYAPAFLNRSTKADYSAYCNLIESKSGLKTLTYEANKFRKEMLLGVQEHNFSDELEIGTTFTLDESLVLLDLLVKNDEADFFERFKINSDNNHYTVNDSLGVRNYFSEDESLRKYIEDTKAELELLSSKLYFQDLKAIGILEDESLLFYLIQNGFATTSIAKFVYKYKTNTELCKQYLNSLKEIKIFSKTDYSNTSDEFRIFELITHLEDTDLVKFRSVIYIDEESLNSKALSNDIWFKIENKSKKISVQLSEILEEYKGKTYSKDTFKNKFKLHHNEEHLQKINKIFDSRNLTIDEIKNKLLELGSINFNAKQLVFWHFYFLEIEDDSLKDNFITFLDLVESNKPKYEMEAKQYFSLMKLENIFQPFKFFNFPGLWLFFYRIWDEEFAIEAERIPEWLREWASVDEGRLNYLFKLGLNGMESAVVKFRKAVKESDIDGMDTHRSSLDGIQLTDTLHWLDRSQITLTKEILKPIFDKLQRIDVSVLSLLIPCIKGERLILIKRKEGLVFHLKHEGWGTYSSAIEDAIITLGQYIIDDTLNDVYQAQLGVVSDNLSNELDIDNINSNSKILDANFYKSWSEIGKITIKTFSSDSLPYISKYQDVIQFSEVESFSVKKINSYYLVAKSSQSRIPECILEKYQDSQLEDLKIHKERYIRENESDDITKIALSKGLEGDQRIATNNEAKKVAIEWLEAKDYDCSDVVTDFDRLCNIIKNGQRVEVIVSSISGGLVYIRPVNWLKLMEENTMLLLVNKTEVTKLDSIAGIIERYPKTLLRVDNSADVEKHLAAIAEETSGTATTQFVFFDEEAKFQEVLTTMQKLADNQNKELNIEIPVNHDFLNE